MPKPLISPELTWSDQDVPISTLFNDPYYSKENGLAEAQYVFLDGNRLGERLKTTDKSLQIAELGFGAGLNFAATVLLLKELKSQAPPIRYTAFELAPLSSEMISRALAPWPELSAIRSALVEHARQVLSGGLPTLRLEHIELTLRIGDARKTVPRWAEEADAWFLDGFSPAKNPEMWEAGLMQAVCQNTRLGGTFATFTAAGHVRRSLTAAGFEVSKKEGFGRKREMLIGKKTR